MQKYDFVAVGDIVTDAFIKLKDAQVHCRLDTEECEICLPFAEKIPYEEVYIIDAVGNASNAAASAAKLGLNTALVTNLGDDKAGEGCIEALERNGVSKEFVKVHEGKKTNYHYVLWYESDRTILSKHEDYELQFPDISETDWLYFSSVAAGENAYYAQVADYLDAHPNVKFAFQPGKNDIRQGVERLARFYKRADIFFCNIEEAEKILSIDTLGVGELIKRIHELGPNIVVITDGPKGAYIYDGARTLFHPPYPDPKPPYERTGAGDAFASTTVAALALGRDLETAVKWAMVNSMSVVQEIGAQKGLLTQEKIAEWLAKAPSDFSSKFI